MTLFLSPHTTELMALIGAIFLIVVIPAVVAAIVGTWLADRLTDWLAYREYRRIKDEWSKR